MESITITPQIKRMVYDQLDYIGVPPDLKGYECLATLIGKILENPNNLYRITYMYTVVGDIHGGKGTQVERVIRQAIEVVFDRMSIDSPIWVWFSYINPQKGKPTNKEFVATVVNMIRRELEEVESPLPGQTKLEEV